MSATDISTANPANNPLLYVVDIDYEMIKDGPQPDAVSIYCKFQSDMPPKKHNLDGRATFCVNDLEETKKFLRFSEELDRFEAGKELILEFSKFRDLRMELQELQSCPLEWTQLADIPNQQIRR